MSKTTEMTVQISGGRVLKTEIVSETKVKLTIAVDVVKESTEDAVTKKVSQVGNYLGETFKLVPASSLSLNDDFLCWKPQTNWQRKFKDSLVKVIKEGVEDFYRPIYDPLLDKDDNIVFVKGEKPAVGHSWNWWNRKIKNMKPIHGLNFRPGQVRQYIAFLGCKMKELLNEGWEISRVWEAVCDNSEELGHYLDSPNPLHDFEPTGSRVICGDYDLGNTCKMLAPNDTEAGGFWLAGGCCFNVGDGYPLADICRNVNVDDDYYFCVGWLVLSK